jgi:hypothetical protein
MSESSIYARLKERITRPTDRFERVENGMGAGMPDVNYCICGVEGWIEIKYPEEPKRPTTALFSGNHHVSVEQCNWMLKQSNAGGISWLFIATKLRLMFIPGAKVGKMGIVINKLRIHELESIAAWKTDVPVMDPLRWMDLREMLCSR